MLGRLPFRFDNNLTKPARHESVTSVIFEAHRPIACTVEAANSLSELLTYV